MTVLWQIFSRVYSFYKTQWRA